MFDYLHKQRKRVKSEKDIEAVFNSIGVESADYQKVMKSFSTGMKARQNQKALIQNGHKISSVPSFVVNGKYLINTRAVNSTSAINELVQYLSVKG